MELGIQYRHIFYFMNPFIEKYHQTRGTHCWYCDREFGVDRSVYSQCGRILYIQREHIIPKSQIIFSYPKNYIAACCDCNTLKGPKTAEKFAQKVTSLMLKYKKGEHNMWHLFPLMRERAWKLYNKTSNLHRNYKKLRFAV